MTSPADDLAAAIRELVDVCVRTEADDATLTAVAAEVCGVVGRLRGAGVREGTEWTDDERTRRGMRRHNPVVGTANPLAPPLAVEAAADGSVSGTVVMRPVHEGPPGAVHGGWVAALLDQLLGNANAAAGVAGYTAELTIRYRRPTPFGEPLSLRARTDEVEGRRVMTSGEIVSEDGTVTATARGLFLRPA